MREILQTVKIMSFYKNVRIIISLHTIQNTARVHTSNILWCSIICISAWLGDRITLKFADNIIPYIANVRVHKILQSRW